MKKVELFKEFQKNIPNMVQSEALMCGITEYSVSIRERSTEITAYIHGKSVTLRYYLSGRVVISTKDGSNGRSRVLKEEHDFDYINGRCTVADMMSKYVFDLFDYVILIRQEWRHQYEKKRKEKKEAEVLLGEFDTNIDVSGAYNGEEAS